MQWQPCCSTEICYSLVLKVSAEIEMALRNMKNGKLLHLTTWKNLGRTGVNFMTEALNKITVEKKIPDILRKSILIPIFTNKGDVTNCGNYRGIKIMCHSMKLYMRKYIKID